MFVKECAVEFRWKDLSKDVIMDIGCGSDFNCCNAILKEFPGVRALIAIDKNPVVLRNRKDKIHSYTGNIEERENLKGFEGKMDKVISTNTIHQITNKKLVFENLYHLLKPGGEAAVLFNSESCYIDFTKALLEIPYFKPMFKGKFTENVYPKEQGSQFYQEMFKEAGFHNVRAKVVEFVIPLSSDEACKDFLFEAHKDDFDILPEFSDEFKEVLFRIYTRTVERIEGKPCYRAPMLSLLGYKST
ncbi:hypothetical protein NPIL_344341 [Nephila pilipes]|uniref:Methyltransferase domain-containing protein n=1 Tax=Nephila pilipes TaxID=299642 RepID=A0A8X6N4T3_NEPPI|nr:hypothetical protein NPIL_344341 [Nephila pilipes]